MTIDTQNIAWAQDKTKFGYQMLLKMGWKEGNGLGKNQDGQATHVKVEIRQDSLGMGMAPDQAGNSKFVESIKGFEEVLAALNKDKSGLIVKAKKKSSKNKKEKTKKKTKDKTDKKGKKKRKRESDDSSQDKVEKTKKTKKLKSLKTKKKEKKEKKALAIKRKANQKLVRSKNVSSYSATDLKAILGGM